MTLPTGSGSSSTLTDRYKGKVYDGEHRVAGMLHFANMENGARLVEIGGSRITMPVERKFASLESIQEYVDKVLKLPSIRERYPSTRYAVRVRRRKGTRFAHYQMGEIAIPMHGSRWACRELVILHELAHHLARGDGHGPKFRQAFCKLTEIAMAPEVSFALQVCWHMSGVPA